jgi:hypothetical protein
MALNVLGWIIWTIIFLLALSWTFGVRKYVSKGSAIPHVTVVQLFFLWAIALVFRFFSFNKLHILWVAPICFFTSIYLTLARRVPIVTPVVLWFAGLCMEIAVAGVKGSKQQ